MIEALLDLKLLITTGMRNASIDLEAARARGVVVCGTPNFGNPTAGIAIGLMLELTRHIGYENDPRPASAPRQTTIGLDLEGLTLALLGLGKLGSRMAEIGRASGNERHRLEPEPDGVDLQTGGRRACRPRRPFPARGFPVDPCTSSPRTRGLIGAKELA